MSEAQKLLVVDDEERIRRLIKMYLEKEDFEIDEAADGKTALEMALQNNYSAIILDIMMPEMDGIQVCEELKKKRIHQLLC